MAPSKEVMPLYNGGAWFVLASEVGAMFCVDAAEAEWYGITKIGKGTRRDNLKVVLSCAEFCKLINRKYNQQIKIY